MIRYDIFVKLQLGIHPVAVVQYTFTNKQYTERHKTNNTQNTEFFGRVRAVPRLCEFYPGICLTTEEKAQENLSVSLTLHFVLGFRIHGDLPPCRLRLMCCCIWPATLSLCTNLTQCYLLALSRYMRCAHCAMDSRVCSCCHDCFP